MLTLAYIVNSLNAGGTEKLVVEMSRALAGTCRVEVLCLDEPGVWAGDLRREGIPVHCLWRQPGLDLAMPARIATHCRRMQADVIHAHQCTPWFYAALSRYLYARPKLLMQEHGRFYPEVLSRRRRLFNRLFVVPRTHRFVAVSADIRRRLDTYEGIPAARTSVIYNGTVAADRIGPEQRAELRRSLGFQPRDFVVGTVGRFDPIKNLPMLVDAIAAAGARDAGIRGLLVGAGPEFEAIRRRVDSLPLPESIVMTGFRSDARALTQCMDLFVLASFSEGTSMALLDALATGVPVAVTDVGGNPEVVAAGESGWVLGSGDTAALARAIQDARNNPAHAGELAAEGVRRFNRSFTFGVMMDAYGREYAAMTEPSGALLGGQRP